MDELVATKAKAEALKAGVSEEEADLKAAEAREKPARTRGDWETYTAELIGTGRARRRDTAEVPRAAALARTTVAMPTRIRTTTRRNTKATCLNK